MVLEEHHLGITQHHLHRLRRKPVQDLLTRRDLVVETLHGAKIATQLMRLVRDGDRDDELREATTS